MQQAFHLETVASDFYQFMLQSFHTFTKSLLLGKLQKEQKMYNEYTLYVLFLFETSNRPQPGPRNRPYNSTRIFGGIMSGNLNFNVIQCIVFFACSQSQVSCPIQLCGKLQAAVTIFDKENEKLCKKKFLQGFFPGN